MNTQPKYPPKLYVPFDGRGSGAIASFVLVAVTGAMPMFAPSVVRAQSAVRAGQAGRSQASTLPAASGVSKLPTQSAVSGLSPAALSAADALFAQLLKSSGRFNISSTGNAAQGSGRGVSKQMGVGQAGYALRATVLQWNLGTRMANGSESTSSGKRAGRVLAAGSQAVVQIQVVDPRTQSVIATVRGTSAGRGVSAYSPAYTTKTPGGMGNGSGSRNRNPTQNGTPGMASLPTGADAANGYAQPQGGTGYGTPQGDAGNTLPQSGGGNGDSGVYTLPSNADGYAGAGAPTPPYPGSNGQTAYPPPGQNPGSAYGNMGGAGTGAGGAMPQTMGDPQALQQAFLDALRQVLSLMERMISLYGQGGNGTLGGLNNGSAPGSYAPPYSSPPPGGAGSVPGNSSYDPAFGGGSPVGNGGQPGQPTYYGSPGQQTYNGLSNQPAYGGNPQRSATYGSNPRWPEPAEPGANGQTQTIPAPTQNNRSAGTQARVLDSRGLPLAQKQVTKTTTKTIRRTHP